MNKEEVVDKWFREATLKELKESIIRGLKNLTIRTREDLGDYLKCNGNAILKLEQSKKVNDQRSNHSSKNLKEKEE